MAILCLNIFEIMCKITFDHQTMISIEFSQLIELKFQFDSFTLIESLCRCTFSLSVHYVHPVACRQKCSSHVFAAPKQQYD